MTNLKRFCDESGIERENKRIFTEINVMGKRFNGTADNAIRTLLRDSGLSENSKGHNALFYTLMQSSFPCWTSTPPL